jgi:glutamate-1-semialdehyde 2,1-aminomutase
MAHFDRDKVGDDGFLMQIGTLSGNPVAAVAGLATLEILKRPGTYEKAFATGRQLMSALGDMLRAAGIPAQVTGEPPLFDVVFAEGPVEDYRAALRADANLARRFNQSLRKSGILKGESKFYLSIAHGETEVAETLKAFETAVAALRA